MEPSWQKTGLQVKKKGQYENTALFLIQYPMKTEAKVQITFHATVIVLSI